MGNKNLLDKTYHYIMETFVERGYAPHYTEIADSFGMHEKG